MTGPRVFGRADEVATLTVVLDALTDGLGQHRIVTIEGQPGIGKTVLWDAARTLAGERGHHVLSTRAVEAEAVFGFAGLADLFDQVPDEILAGLPAPQRHALRVALLRDDAGGVVPDPRSIATASLAVLRSLAAIRPVLVAVDDLQWLDASTRRVLAFALRRIGSDRIGFVATVRVEPGYRPDLPTDDVARDNVLRITPEPLSIGVLREVVADRLGVVPSRHVLTRVYETSGGNPFFALELARALRDDQADPGAPAERLLPVPDTLRPLVLRRIAQLPAPVRDVLLTVALAATATREVVAASRFSVDHTSAVDDLDAAVRAGIVRIRRDVVEFTHPLLRSVVIDDATPRQRRAVHAGLAGVVTAPAARARHRALALDSPNEDAAAAVESAAQDERRRGSPETAAELTELALSVTPAGTPHDTVVRRTFAAAEYRFESGDPARARDLVAPVVAAHPPGPARAGLLVAFAKFHRYGGAALADWLGPMRQALVESDQRDWGLRVTVHMLLAMSAVNGDDPAAASEHLAAMVELGKDVRDAFLGAQLAACIAYLTFVTGHGTRRDLLTRAVSADRDPVPVPVEVSPTYTAAVVYAHAGDLATARQLLDADFAQLHESGDEISIPTVTWLAVRLETWAGDWARAERLATEALESAELAGSSVGIAGASGTRAVLRAAQGRVDDARRDAAVADGHGRRITIALPVQLAAEAIGLLELSLGHAQAAHDAMDESVRYAVQSGVAEARMVRLLPLEVEALIALNRLDEAGDLLELLEHSAEQPAHDAWSEIVALRCRGLLLTAAGDLRGADLAVTSAVERSAGLGMPFERARTLLAAGEIQRRARRRRVGAESVTAAKAIFDELGCPLWSQRCDLELDRASSSKRSGAAATTLTPTEQRVAALAAEGRTSREIAADLFMGVRTVEAHLQRCYQKLGVRSRVELARTMDRGQALPVD